MDDQGFLNELEAIGIHIWPRAERLLYRGSSEALTPSRLAALKSRKARLLELLRQRFPLSEEQRALWVFQEREPDSSAYNQGFVARLLPPVSPGRLSQACDALVARHPTLRTTFTAQGTQVVQTVHPPSSATILEEVEATDWSEKQLDEAVCEFHNRPFDLRRAPAFRTRLWQRTGEDSIFALVFHHLVADGWSLWLLLDELLSVYAGDFEAQPMAPYADHVYWQRDALHRGALDPHWDYWREHLSGELPSTALPTDRRRPAVQTYDAQVCSWELPGALIQALKDLARRHQSTLYVSLLTCLQSWIARVVGRSEVLLGTSASGRREARFAQTLGYFSKTLVLFNRLPSDMPFTECLERTRDVVFEAVAHQDLPFITLLERLQVPRDPSRSPLFQMFFVLQEPQQFGEIAEALMPGAGTVQARGLRLRAFEVRRQEIPVDLTFEVLVGRRKTFCFWKYNPQLFDDTTILRWARQFETLLGNVLRNPQAESGALSFLTVGETHQLLQEWSDSATREPQVRPLPDRFWAQVRSAPDAVAVTADQGGMTRGTLLREVESLAHRLRVAGVEPEIRVAICVDRGLDLPLALLAVLSAGGTCVPLDPSDPMSRHRTMIDDSTARLVLTQHRFRKRFADLDLPVLDVASERGTGPAPQPRGPSPRLLVDQLAYVLYTSGSTGRPKGVMGSHRNVARLFADSATSFEFDEDDCWSLFHSYTFDFSVWELWGPLLTGGRLVVVPEASRRDPDEFFRLLLEQRVTVLNQTPSAFRSLARAASAARLRSLRWILFGGESLDPRLLEPWRTSGRAPGARWVNLYGITETTVHVTARSLTPGTVLESPIGRALPDRQLYVLDTSGRPVPTGVSGELYIGGGGLTRGYLGQPARTAERFVPHPWATRPGQRLYRSGDLARFRANGELTYLGRTDRQLKIRGFRVEPGEIEQALEAHPLVREAAVEGHHGEGAISRLVAYLSFQETPEGSSRTVAEREQVELWRGIYEQRYGVSSPSLESAEVPEPLDAFELAGWTRSHDGQPFSQEEMREWLEHTLARIRALPIRGGAPRRILEIGCGTGMLLQRLASDCDFYLGIDSSPTVLSELARRIPSSAKVELREMAAHDLESLAEEAFDLVILNSVVQYFPSIPYLVDTLCQVAGKLAPGGAIFVGDLRDFRQFEAWSLHVERARQGAVGAKDTEELARRAERLREREEELLVDPALFSALESALPALLGVEVQRKKGLQNELNLFRYDVTLRFGEVQFTSSALPELPGNPFERFGNDPLGPARRRRALSVVQRDLAERLPAHLQPAVWVPLAALPRLVSGKIDRRAFPPPETRRPILEVAPEEPRNAAERSLVAGWQEVLGLEQVGIHDDFFLLGGDSILSIQIVGRLAQLGWRLAPRDFFSHPTIARLASRARPLRPQTWQPASEVESGAVPLTPIQSWFFARDLEEPWHFNQALLLPVRKRLRLPILEAALQCLERRHGALRLAFARDGNHWLQVQRPPRSPWAPFLFADLSGLSSKHQESALQQVAARVQGSLDLLGPLWRSVFFGVEGRSEKASGSLLLVIHHLAVDAVSWRILLADLEAFYSSLEVEDSPPNLTRVATSYKGWAESLQSFARRLSVPDETQFWRTVAGRSTPLPRDFEGGANSLTSAASLVTRLPSEATAALLRPSAGELGPRFHELLILALARALRRWLGKVPVILDVEGHGREALDPEIDLSQTVGWFTTFCPLTLELGGAETPDGAAQLCSTLRRAMARSVHHGLLRHPADLETPSALADLPAAEIAFNYLGRFDTSFPACQLFEAVDFSSAFRGRLGPLMTRKGMRSHVLEVHAETVAEQLEITWTWSRHLHRRATIATLAESCLEVLRDPSWIALLRGVHVAAQRPTLQGNRGHVFPLTPMQHGLLYHSLAAPETPVYFEQYAWDLGADVQAEGLRQAWQRVVERHGALRTSFRWRRREVPLQETQRSLELPWRELDWSSLGEDFEQRFESWLEEDRRDLFELSRSPLFRLTFIHRPGGGARFVWSFHHLIVDGWSWSIVLGEVFDLYQAWCRGETLHLPSPFPFWDYVAWFEGRDMAPTEAFWRQELAGLEGPTPLPLERPHPPPDLTDEHAQMVSSVPAGQISRLKPWAARHRLTPAVLVEAAWALLLARLNARSEAVFGVVFSGRTASLAPPDTMVGMYVCTLPLRVEIPGRESVLSWLVGLRNKKLDLWHHHAVALTDLKEWSEIHGGTELFEHLVVCDNYPFPERLESWLGLETLQMFSRTHYPLLLLTAPHRGLTFWLNYAVDRFERTTMQRLLASLQELLVAFLDQPESPLESLSTISPVARHQMLYEWNDATSPEVQSLEGACLQDLVVRQAQSTPEAIAVVGTSLSLSYRMLDDRAQGLAARLRELGAGPEVPVAFLSPRSPARSVGLLGILYAGATCVPLSPSYPAKRLAFQFEDSGVRLLVAPKDLLHLLPLAARNACRILDLDAIPQSAVHKRTMVQAMSPDHPAYRVYTSGSTGRPKGVVMTHRALVSLILWHRWESSASLRTLQFAPMAFDVSFYEMFMAWSTGGTLVQMPGTLRTDLLRLDRALRTQRVERLILPPPVLRELAGLWRHQDSVSVREVLSTGERLQIEDILRSVARRFPQICWHNHYGPSETHVVTSHSLASRAADWLERPAIGTPIPRVQIYLLGPEFNPVPPGTLGELVLGGIALARGYWQRSALTALKFVPDPWSPRPGGRLYRSGDLARYDSIGRVHFLGRMDRQVKVRGHRVELGEIEGTLVAHPEVEEAAVLASSGELGLRLIAFLTLRRGSPGGMEQILRHHLEEHLPRAMVPKDLHVLEEMPHLPNGKIDLKALPVKWCAEGGHDLTPPRNPIEDLVVEIWQEVLGGPAVGIDTDFFARGGNSLVAMRVAARAHRLLGVELSPRLFFDHPTPRQLALAVEPLLQGEAPVPPRPLSFSPRPTHPRLASAQERLWFLDQLYGTRAYHLAWAWYLQGDLDPAALSAALSAVVARHEVLRTRFPHRSGQPWQCLEESYDFSLPVVDLQALPMGMRHRAARHLLWKRRVKRFDLLRGPLFRTLCCLLDEEHSLLSIEVHHIVWDGGSQGIFLEELARFYTQARQRRPLTLSPIPVQYIEFAHWQRQRLASGALEPHLSWWRQYLDRLTLLNLPTDRLRLSSHRPLGRHHAVRLPQELVGDLRTVCQATSTSQFMAFLAIFMVFLGRISGQRDVVVGSPVSQRDRPEFEGTLGFFVNQLVLRGSLAGGATFHRLLETLRASTLEAYAHRDVPFETLVDALAPSRDLGRHPLVQVSFALEAEPIPSPRLESLVATPLDPDLSHVRFDLELYLWPEAEDLRGVLVASRELFHFTTLRRWARAFETLAGAVVRSPGRAIDELSLLQVAEQHQLLHEWPLGPRRDRLDPPLLHQRVNACARSLPEALAVVERLDNGMESWLTYGTLRRQVGVLVGDLRSQGATSGTVVGIDCGRASQLLVALLAVLEAGGIFLNLSPDDPPERHRTILSEAQAGWVVRGGELVPVPGGFGSAEVEKLATKSSIPPSEAQAAYLLFTSGSTGVPKGVEVSHGALMDYLQGVMEACDLRSLRGAVVCTNPAFDLTLTALLTPLLAGGCVHLVPTEASVGEFGDFLARWGRGTLLKVTPSHLPLLENIGGEPSPRYGVQVLILGGEPVPQSAFALWHRHFPGAVCFNEYGPTEAVVGSVLHRLSATPPVLAPIGRAMAGVSVFLLASNLVPVPVGTPGEIHLGGPRLASGYRNRPAETATAFVPDPFTDSGGRLYRTGDLATWDSEGRLHFIGRRDLQLKITGHRLDPGEVEALLTADPAVRAAVVVGWPDADGRHRLVAYLEVGSEAPKGLIPALRQSVQRVLPRPLQPMHYVVLETLPRRSGGKIAREQLPDPPRHVATRAAGEAPRDPLESQIARSWCQILGVDSVGILENFFELGGDSLRAFRLTQLLNAHSLDLKLRDLFEAQTVATQAARLRSRSEEQEARHETPYS